jgi:hypothetical protein
MTTDWTKQAEEVVRNWTNSQQKMWESWLSMMQGAGTNPAGEMWEKTVDTWHDSMKTALASQVTWAKFWADSVAANSGTSKQMTEMSQQTVEMTKRWTETQTQILDNWFETIKKTDPASVAKNMNPEEMQKAMQAWQDATRKMMESQMEMIRTWTAPTSGTTGKK